VPRTRSAKESWRPTPASSPSGSGSCRSSTPTIASRPHQRGAHYYNFWRDGEHPRGLWRRTSLESYRSDAPEWDTVLDLDALAEAEEENWVWHGASCEDRGGSRCLVHLSRGGADASVIREFDTATKAFVDDDPFVLPEAKSDVDWIDRDTIFVATDFGEGTLTESGYPRQVRRWRRGTPLSEAELILEGTPEDMIVGAWHSLRGGDERDVAYIRTSSSPSAPSSASARPSSRSTSPRTRSAACGAVSSCSSSGATGRSGARPTRRAAC
jgi:prolyl oligopeptidase PreP (S9A serine peptidase family)